MTPDINSSLGETTRGIGEVFIGGRPCRNRLCAETAEMRSGFCESCDKDAMDGEF